MVKMLRKMAAIQRRVINALFTGGKRRLARSYNSVRIHV
jgi:hypothetical protein